MEEKLIGLLGSIGLGKNEIEVYLDILKNSASTAYVIANRINRHRSSVYDSLKKLMRKGFIVEIQEEKRKLYQTKECTSIEEYLNQKQAELKEIAPYIKKISNTEIPEGSVSISYGLARLRTMFSSLSDPKQEVLIWTIPQNIENLIGEWFFEEASEKLSSKKIPLKVIFSKFFTAKKFDKSPSAEIRYLDDESNMFTVVFGDQVFLIVLESPLVVIEMKSALIARGFLARFNIFWNKAAQKAE